MHKITIEITDETYERITALRDIVNHRRNNHDDLETEDIVKGALLYYLNRFSDETIYQDEIEKLIPLGSDAKLTNIINEYLTENDISPTRVASDTHTTRKTISEILSNKKQPSLDLFIRIWVSLGCPPLHKLLKREAKGETNNTHTSQEES